MCGRGSGRAGLPGREQHSCGFGMNCTGGADERRFDVQGAMTKTAEDLRYPIGRFQAVMPVTSELRGAAIDAIGSLPSRMRAAVTDLSDAQLDTPYRPE